MDRRLLGWVLASSLAMVACGDDAPSDDNEESDGGSNSPTGEKGDAALPGWSLDGGFGSPGPGGGWHEGGWPGGDEDEPGDGGRRRGDRDRDGGRRARPWGDGGFVPPWLDRDGGFVPPWWDRDGGFPFPFPGDDDDDRGGGRPGRGR